MAMLCIRPNPSEHQHTLYDRVSKLLDSFEWSDVTFVVGNQVVKAHKLILAISSPVFKVMFYGPMSGESEIIISDIEPQVFQLLLDFIYKDKVVIDTLQNACGLLYASKKYMLPYLTDMCVKYIKKSTSVTNVMSIYSFSDWVQEEQLFQHTLSLICKHADIVLNKYFDQVTDGCLVKILEESCINISEKELIHIVWVWSHNECLERGLSPTNENKRQLLLKSNILSHLRFLTLSKQDRDWLRQTGVLTNQEINSIDHILQAKDQVIAWKLNDSFILNENSTSRNPLGQEWIFCRRPIIRSATPLVISNVSQCIKFRFKCNKTVFIKSFLFPSRHSINMFHKDSVVNSYLENIVVTLSSSNVNNVEDKVYVTYNKIVEYNNTIFVELPKPFMIIEEEWYTLCVSWPGNKSQLLRYPLSYRPNTTYHSEPLFTFDDNYESTSSLGSFMEGLVFCI